MDHHRYNIYASNSGKSKFIIIYLTSMYINLILYTPFYRDTKIDIIAHLGLAKCEGCVKHYAFDKLNINLE